MSHVLWQPDTTRVAQANATTFMESLRRTQEIELPDFSALYRWSIENPHDFWQAVWRYCEVVSSHASQEAVRDFDRMPGAIWFPEARLNFAENLLRHRDRQEALVFWNERGPQRRLTFAQLYGQVARAASALRKLGVQPGDRVAGYLPNLPEAVVAMLATASLGAIWSSCSPDFGAHGLVNRFAQIEPRLLLTADAYLYKGRTIDCLDTVSAARHHLPTLEKILVIPYLHEPSGGSLPEQALLWTDLTAAEPAPLTFEQLPFDHPLYILFSSGTTGPPKCIVHSAGGTLLQHLKELVLHTDLKRADCIFYFTTCGWMMWNWLVSSLAVGAKVLLYDGSPFAPHPRHLFDMAEKERVSIFGTSAKYLAAAEKEGLAPADSHDLSSLRTILSTGSPLKPESFDYVYEKVKRDVCLSSISGGTDLVSCFALGNPLGPVRRGELQTRGLGMKVEIYNQRGQTVREECGELVCTAAFPSMPIGFWNDPTGSKYRQAYFEHFPGVWRHGDFAQLTAHEGLVIFGRSDAVLNPGGVRIGTAEIYSQVEQLPEVLESVAVGQQYEGDERIILFVKLRPAARLDDALTARIQQQIRRNTTPRHVPAKVLQVEDIPRTQNGKIAELAVRDVIHQRPVSHAAALANPEALKYFEGRPELS